MARHYIKDLKKEMKVEGVFLLKKKELAKTTAGKPFLKLSFADKTGSIEGKVWDDAEAVNAAVETGTAVRVKGSVDAWKDNLQVKVDAIRPAAAEEYAAADLMRTVENRDELLAAVKGYFSRVSSKWVALLAAHFFNDAPFMEKFYSSPAASSWHNAYIGGLLEHTHEVMVIVDRTCDLYPEANRDIAVIGAFLHDIGKVVELDPATFENTVAGGLIGHLPLGFEMLSAAIAAIDGFPPDLATQLKHIILSHHGEYEQQSPILPKTLEATIIYHADNLVSQANAVREIILAQAPSGREWSNFVTIKNRKYFLKKPE